MFQTIDTNVLCLGVLLQALQDVAANMEIKRILSCLQGGEHDKTYQAPKVKPLQEFIIQYTGPNLIPSLPVFTFYVHNNTRK